jgi:hypothetical protein
MKSTHAEIKRSRNRQKKPDAELVQIFWNAPLEARFGEDTVAAVTQRNVKTLQCYRWKRSGIPFAKVLGRVLYRKSDVVDWLNSFGVVSNTSEYATKEGHNEQI